MTKKQRKTLCRIVIAAALYALAVAAPLEGMLRLAAFLAVYAIIGGDILLKAARNITRGQVFDENFLMSVATVGALCLGEYPEAVAVMLFYQIGELFQSYAVGKSRQSIAALMDIRPDYANVERGGKLEQVDPEEVAEGELIVVKPGERIPLDGVVEEGSSSVDTAALTGESVPREVLPGHEVISGCVNLSGMLKVRVSREFGQSTVARILDLVENSTARKSRSEHFITRFARYYTPAVVFAALALAAIPPLIFGQAFSIWVERALTFLVISCPCALVISIPLSFFGGIGGASRSGILVKGGNYLEALADVSIVAFDKTGTLTRGSFEVVAVHPEQIGKDDLLGLAALVESYSDHPISRSLREAWGGEIDRARVSSVEEIPGQGVRAAVDGRQVAVGSLRLMESMGAKDARECHLAGTSVHVAVDGAYQGHIVIADVAKPDAAEAIRELKALGVRKTVMLTGDARKVGESVARELGIDDYYAELLPADKVAGLERLLAEKRDNEKLAFVGDGINDAPVLGRADVGIAMGALGSDAAIEAADVVLMDDKPTRIADAMRIARKTLRIVRQNIVFALGVKGVVLALGAAGLANMWAAVFADVGVSVIAILNAMRALDVRKK